MKKTIITILFLLLITTTLTIRKEKMYINKWEKTEKGNQITLISQDGNEWLFNNTNHKVDERVNVIIFNNFTKSKLDDKILLIYNK